MIFLKKIKLFWQGKIVFLSLLCLSSCDFTPLYSQIAVLVLYMFLAILAGKTPTRWSLMI